MQHFTGMVIAESLADKKTLHAFTVIKTEVEKVTPEHNTPWVTQWTLHTVEIPYNEIDAFTSALSRSLDTQHSWYADFKNNALHYIVFRNKVFVIDRQHPEQYKAVTNYGITIGIPQYQLDFSPHVQQWQRVNIH